VLIEKRHRVVRGVRPTTLKLLWPIALVALSVGAPLWFALRTSTIDNEANKASNAFSQTSNASLGAFTKTSIPGGVNLNIPQNGMENKLLAFIKDPNAPVNAQTWFEFDRLTFAIGTSMILQISSQEQLQGIADILKAYPNVHVRINAYTDDQSGTTANLKLSQDRANSVMAQLVARGVDSLRLDAIGYGEDHPVADNSTEEGRAGNRRITLRMIRK